MINENAHTFLSNTFNENKLCMKRNRGRGNEKYTADTKLFSLQHNVPVNIESNYLITAVLTIHIFRRKDWNMAIILFKQYVSCYMYLKT